MKTKPTSLAGICYPENSDDLINMLARWLLQKKPIHAQPRAVIVPHSGYVHSGEVAAKAFQYLHQHNQRIQRVILLTTTKHYTVGGCTIPSHDAFSTPIGVIQVDHDLRRLLKASPWVIEDDLAYLLEQGIEIQLPFLQMCLANYTLLPIIVGQMELPQLLEVFNLCPINEETLFVISVDLSNEIIDDNLLNNKYNVLLQGFSQFCQDQNWHTELVSRSDAIAHANQRYYASFVVYSDE